jgi:hypothetical protein
MRSTLLALLPLSLLAGCAGYAIDYVKPKAGIIASELPRYGLTPAQVKCVGDRLAATLTVWEVRQLAIVAGLVTAGPSNPRPLDVRDLVWASSRVEDKKVRTGLIAAVKDCGLEGEGAAGSGPAYARAAGQGIGAAPALPTPAIAPSAVSKWVTIGVAPTGQGIDVDTSSVEQAPAYREAWFRLTNPGETRPVPTSYRLRVDCAARTINPMSLRKHSATGVVTERRDYGPGGDGAAPVEAGTVMELAYRALCS